MFIRAVLIDLDETIYDERHCVKYALEKASAHAVSKHSTIQRQLLETTYLTEANKRWDAFEAEIRIKGRSVQLDSLRVREMCFAQALAISNGPPSLAPELTRFYGEIRKNHHLLFSDAKRVLDKLRKQAFLALVTNGGSTYQREKIRATGIEHFFHTIVISEEAGYSKPQKGIFEKALREVGVPAHEAVMVGDSVENDVSGARIAGMRGILVVRNGSKHQKVDVTQISPQPDAIVSSLNDLIKTLTEFAGQKA
ncbi:MAG: HAD family hydrolase [Planctomycetota bacterium]